jgi:hypothetical protein
LPSLAVVDQPELELLLLDELFMLLNIEVR